MYGDFFRAVREVNRSLDAERKLRVLLGDPPVDWDLVRRVNEGPASEREGKVQINGIWIARDQASTLDRDKHAADLIQQEVLAKGRRALLVFGEMHVRRMGRSVVERLERSASIKVFNIINAAGTSYDALTSLRPDLASWPVPSLLLIPTGMQAPAHLGQSDAILYFGSPATITFSKLAPSLCRDPAYLKMRRERMRWTGMAESKSDAMLARDCGP